MGCSRGDLFGEGGGGRGNVPLKGEDPRKRERAMSSDSRSSVPDGLAQLTSSCSEP